MSLRCIIKRPHSLILLTTTPTTRKRQKTTIGGAGIVDLGTHCPNTFCFLPNPEAFQRATQNAQIEPPKAQSSINPATTTTAPLFPKMDAAPGNTVTDPAPSKDLAKESQGKAEAEAEAESKSEMQVERDAEVKTEVGVEVEAEIEAEGEGEAKTNESAEVKAEEHEKSSNNQEIDTNEVLESTQPQQNQTLEPQKEDEPFPIDGDIEEISVASSHSLKDRESEFCLVFEDFVDLQTRLVLIPYIEEEAKGAIVASYPENDRFEGLVLSSMNHHETNEEPPSLHTMDFTDILAGLREQSTPICLTFERNGDDEKDLMINVDLCPNEIHEEKKDEEDRNSKTPKRGNRDMKLDNAKPTMESPAPDTQLQVETSSLPPKPTYLEMRESTPSREHTQSLNSVLDDHRSGNNNNDNTTAGSTLSSGMFALSAWGMRMKAQSEKLLATAGAKAAAQQQQNQPRQPQPDSQHAGASKSSPNESPPNSQQQESHCEMYLQTNLGTYFPISKFSGKAIKPQHLQAVTTSSLYCIRKSATEPCIAGRNTIHNNNTVRYSFQWYRSSSGNTSSRRDRCPISPSALYNNIDNDESIGASTSTSRAYSSTESVSSSGSSWSSSANSSSSGSSYSLASGTTGTNTATTATRLTKESHKNDATTWIPLQGAIGASFQPNTTLVGKKLRCVVTVCPVCGTSSDEEDDNHSNNNQHQHKNQQIVSMSARGISTTSSGGLDDEGSSTSLSSQSPNENASAIMDGEDEGDDDDNHTNVNDISILEEDDEERNGIGRSLLQDEDEGVERIVCDLAAPIQADMVLFNGSKQAMINRGSANFGNLLGRGGGTSTDTNTQTLMLTPATATSACGKLFRIEVATTRKTVLYTPPLLNDAMDAASTGSTIQQQQQHRAKPQRRTVNVNSVQIYCRSSSKDDYVHLTDIPLLQVSARASPTNSKQMDLLFPAIPPLPTNDDGEIDEDVAKKSATHRFLSDYCIVDHASCIEGGIPRLELEAPNRMTRESFLLALGIANFRGKPMHLDNKKVLYRDDEPILQQQKKQHKQQQQSTSASTTCSSKTSPKNNSLNSRTDSPSIGASPQPSQPYPLSSPQSSEPSNFNSKNEKECNSLAAASGEKNSHQILSGNLSSSPSRPSDVIGGSKNALSPISYQSNSVKSVGMLNAPAMPSSVEVNNANLARVKELQRELELLRSKMMQKDTMVTELQRQVQGSEAAHQTTKHALASTHQDLKQSQEDCERIQMSKRHVERTMQSQHEAVQHIEADHRAVIQGFEGRLSQKADKIAELEKLNRALQNEKAVLGATVEARESKLVKLEELQVSNSELSKKIAGQGALETQLEESRKKCERLQASFESRQEAETNCRAELEAAKGTIESIRKRIRGEQDKAFSCQSQLETLQKKNQQLQGERNGLKQKNESLSKEVARLCRGGKNIRDIEKVLADHESLLQETELLRAQKRKALEDAHKYRILLEQAKAAEELMLLKPDEKETLRILERTGELERLLSEMTDYVSAKQMQMDTMKEVNEELQKEIHSLAKANLRRDEV